MKKLLYTIIFTIVACASISSCTEEVIKPQTSNGQPTGSGIKE